jgi:hypothetical protein
MNVAITKRNQPLIDCSIGSPRYFIIGLNTKKTQIL